MQLVLNNGYSHQPNEVLFRAVNRRVETNPGGQRTSLTVSWQLEGFLQAADQLSLSLAMKALEAAYSRDGFIAVFVDNSGNNSAHRLGEAGSRNGCRVVGGVNWGWSNGAEYTTFRSYSIQLEADYDNPFANIWLFEESISRKGTTGPRVVWKPCLNGEAQRQITFAQTTMKVVQKGAIIGMYQYVAPPPPLWPAAALPELEESEQHSPKRYGPIGAPYYREYATSYAYYFESNVPLFGIPNRWVG